MMNFSTQKWPTKNTRACPECGEKGEHECVHADTFTCQDCQGRGFILHNAQVEAPPTTNCSAIFFSFRGASGEIEHRSIQASDAASLLSRTMEELESLKTWISQMPNSPHVERTRGGEPSPNLNKDAARRRVARLVGILSSWAGTIYEGKNGDIRILDPETREFIEGHIQFADSKEGYYVHKVRSEDGFKTWHKIVNRPILIQRLDRSSNTWLDCPPPPNEVLSDQSPVPQ